MLLNAVILILQETLEAALLISVLAAVCHFQRQKFTWLLGGMLAGVFFAAVYAANIETISGWFDYVGQEVVNATLHAAISLLIAVFFWATLRGSRTNQGLLVHQSAMATLAAGAIVMLAITREGSEIVLFMGGLIQQKDKLQAVLMGSGLGFGIGLSIGFLLFYGLLGMPAKWGMRAAVFLLALFAGNMLSQAAMQLIQADWISATQAVWDSSGWLAEQSVLGQLLYALVGYEATPPLWYVIAYVVGFAWVIGVVALNQRAAAKTKPAISAGT